LPGPWNAFEVVDAPVLEPEVVCSKRICDGTGDKSLTRPSQVADALRDVNREADDVVGPNLDLAEMDARSYL
jgi:hypothetical protein